MTVNTLLNSLTEHFLEAAPRPLPVDLLVRTLELEQEPTSLLVIGHDLRAIRLLRDAFPEVVPDVVSASSIGPILHDTVVLVGHPTPQFPEDPGLVERIIAQLQRGARLALARTEAGNPRSLSHPEMRTLHLRERRSWRGDWTETLYLGRKL